MSKAKIMKTLLCLCMLLIPLGMSAQGKKVNINVKDASLSSALRQVEQQSGYYKINYPSAEVSRYKVTANVKNASAPQAVNELLQGLPFTSSVNGQFIQIKQSARAASNGQRKTVRGQVLDSDGEPLIGVTVQVAGTNQGAVTDADGNYVLEDVNESDMLTYSYIGKRSMQRRAGSKRAVIILEDSSNLMEEVMVTGYQQLSRERATGAFDRVNREQLEARPSADISAALQGMVAGMQGVEKEDGTVEYLIRGTSSLYANTAPLVVVDGFPIEGTFNSINPNDVESVTVLKDAAAASIWGARSANGVIVVTTKKAKQGNVKVDAQAFWRIGTTPDLEYVTGQASSQQTVDYEVMALQHGYNWGDWAPGGIDGFMCGLTEVEELYYRNIYDGLSEADMKAGWDKLRQRSNRQQLKDYLMQQQLLQQYNVSISGGNERYNSYLSLMYEKNDEATIKRGYERFMANFNTEYRFNKHIKATAAMTWQKRRDNTTGVTLSEFSSLQPYEMLKNDDGSYAYNAQGFNRLGLDGIDTSVFPYDDFSYNMLREVENRNYKSDTDRIRIQLGLNFNIIKGLDYDIKYQYETNRTDSRNEDGEGTYATRYDVNFYTGFDTRTNTLTGQYLPLGSRLNQSTSKNHNNVFRNQLTYNNIFAEKHDISALAGIEVSEYVTNSITQPTTYGYNPNANTAPVPWYGSMDNIQNLYNYSYYSTMLTGNMGYRFSERTDRFLSYFVNAAYMFDERYGVSFSARWDGSNFVSEDKSLRWSPMWSIGGKWNISKESFMKDINWVNWLTLRATYGLNGNAEKSTSPQTLISVSPSSVTHTNVARVASYGNPTLRWEITHTTNIGVDFSLFKNALSGKIDYYNRKSKDVIGSVAIPSVYGSSEQKFNNAEISNRGIEIELDGKFNIQSIGLGIRSTLTYAYNKNKVTKLYNPNLSNYYYSAADDPSNQIFIEGDPVGAIYAYDYDRMEDGVPYIKNEDGTSTPMNNYEVAFGSQRGYLHYHGTTIAPHTLGWANEFSWQGLSLYVYLTGKFGHKFRTPVPSIPPLVSDSKEYISRFITVFTESDGSEHPSLPNDYDYMYYQWQYYHNSLSCYVEDASFIRLKEMTLSYQLPKKWMRALHISQAKVFCQARDLGLLWKANNVDLDPEWLPTPDGGVNKPATSFTLGVNLKF